ncbi:TlpA disulfide reductase family protein [Solwaraspora sp. WMMD406]|uniref:TlpA family protein disulfide reductase n=1 Tax=Solwaraspora sp. WMMD406 TaxID=3016095 RepID=UPI00241715B2|nr:TlpA disulfide reductase family protein [Solwaraspora sp. WMMD406]MDG4768481.1 TlpA disulfide reductase family protein [Solwaraspora sp. WMMD406]
MLALVVPVLLVAGCTGDPVTPAATEPVPFADCARLTAPPVEAVGDADAALGDVAAATTGDADPSRAAGPAATPLPTLSLPCFADGTAVDVAALRGPAVISLWASWCPPCRDELPVLQRLSDRTAGQLHVIGVNTADDRGRALDLANDLGLSFPNLVDPQERLRRAVRRVGLPLTIVVDARGDIRLLHQESELDDAALAELVEHELRVTVAP